MCKNDLANRDARSLALVRSCSELFPFVPTFPSSRFSTYYSLSLFLCLFLPLASPLLFPCARYILCGIHTPYMESPFPIVLAEWSLVFWSFKIMLFRVEKDFFKITNNNRDELSFFGSPLVLIRFISDSLILFENDSPLQRISRLSKRTTHLCI